MNKIFEDYIKKKNDRFLYTMKGGKEMETKSRYEVIAELEEKKRELIMQKDNLNQTLIDKKRQLKELQRKIEDQEENIENFEDSMETQKLTLQTLIDSIDESLKRLATLQQKQ